MANQHYRKPVWETTSEAGAKRLAHTIEAYWAKRGRPDVKARVEEHVFRSDVTHRKSIFVVRSNLYGGLPPAIPMALAA